VSHAYIKCVCVCVRERLGNTVSGSVYTVEQEQLLGFNSHGP